MTVETRLTDVRLKINLLKLILGILLTVMSVITGFLSTVIGLMPSVLLAVSFIVIGNYLLATCQIQCKDIALKIDDSLKVNSQLLEEVKIDKHRGGNH